MRYTSHISHLTLHKTDGTLAYRFYNHVLVVGNPTSTTDVIDATDLLKPYSGSSNLEEAGLGVLFWEAPPISDAANLTDAGWYEVLTGAVTIGGKTYYKNQVFYYDGSATKNFSTGASVAAVPWWARYGDEVRRNHGDAEYFRVIHLEWGDEAEWTGSKAVSKQQFGSTR